MMKGKDHITTSISMLKKMRKWFVGTYVQGGTWVRRVKAVEQNLKRASRKWQKVAHRKPPTRRIREDLGKLPTI